MTVIPAFGRLREKDGEFKASLCYKIRPCLKKPVVGVVPQRWSATMHKILGLIPSTGKKKVNEVILKEQIVSKGGHEKVPGVLGISCFIIRLPR
jgi:hypothetical protein